MKQENAAPVGRTVAESVPAQPGEPTGSWKTISTSWLDKARQKDQDAWNRLYHLYRPMVRRWIRRYRPEDSDIDDLVQTVFLKVWRSLAQFRREKPGDSFRSWIWRVARNVLIDEFRRVGNQPAATGRTTFLQILNAIPEDPPDDEVPCCSELGKRALYLLKNQFEERTWQAVYMSVVEDRPVAEIAEQLQMSKAGVRQARYRVLNRLRDVGRVCQARRLVPASIHDQHGERRHTSTGFSASAMVCLRSPRHFLTMEHRIGELGTPYTSPERIALLR